MLYFLTFVINMPIIIKNNFVNTLLNKAIKFHHSKYLKLFIDINNFEKF